MKKIMGIFLLLSCSSGFAESDCPSSNYAVSNHNLPAHCRTYDDPYDFILREHISISEEVNNNELKEIIETYKEQTLDIRNPENKEIINSATAKMAVILSQFSRTEVDYQSLLNSMNRNIEAKGTHNGLLQPTLNLMDSMLASGKIKAARLMMPIIDDLNIHLGVNLEDKLNLYSDFKPNQMEGFLYDVNIHENQVNFGSNTIKGYKEFQENFSNLIKGNINETSGGFGETGPIFGNTGINTSPARDSMSGFVGACHEWCGKGTSVGTTIGAIGGGAIGAATGTPMGVFTGAVAGGGAGAILGCAGGCVIGVIKEIVKEKPKKEVPKVEPKVEEPKVNVPKTDKPKPEESKVGNAPLKCREGVTCKNASASTFNPTFDRDFDYDQSEFEDNGLDTTSIPTSDETNENDEEVIDLGENDFDSISTPLERL